MKKSFLLILLSLALIAQGQVYNNEWIIHSQTYYKFHVGKNGAHRIPHSVLAAAGLAATPAEYFQLWRNGRQVPLYISTAAGTLSPTDYIEFWGEQNDGKPDRELYRDPSFQLNDKWSLESDTAAYFLTVHPNPSANLRLVATPNNVSGTTLSPESYFMYTAGKYFRDQLNPGFAVNVGEFLYSSSYDRGEGWSSPNIVSTTSLSGVNYGSHTFTLNNLYTHGSGPAPVFRIAVTGNSNNQRRFRVNINSDSVFGKQSDFFNITYDSTSFPLSVIGSGNAAVTVTNISSISCVQLPDGSWSCPNDRMVIHKYEITYPRQFNFGGASSFEFIMPESTDGNFLQISNFNYGSQPPVLYDLTNGERYIADMTLAPVLQFVLQPSATERRLVLVNREEAELTAISSLQQRNFIDYSQPGNAGNFLIITHPVLFNSTVGLNPVEEYRNYRSSAAGGSYDVKIYLADDLIDQFGFGIRKNPAGIRNFIRFARNSFQAAPEHVFIIGKGVVYREQRTLYALGQPYQSNLDKLNLVPTFGHPASDVLFAADPGSSLPMLPVGRLSVIEGDEILTYLDKVKEYELAQTTTGSSIADRAWMKNVVHIVGANEPVLGNIIDQYMNNYRTIISDTLFGGYVTTFSKTSSTAVQQLSTTHLQNLFAEGISLITYFGHSSASTLEFNLDVPDNYNNPGKYPVFFGLGCNAGNFYTYNTARFAVKETLSEKYVLAKDRGVIGFVASTHFGIVHYLNIWADQAYRELGYRQYGGTIGSILQKTVERVLQQTTQNDFYARSNAEQTQFHGDPALRFNYHPKPDYVIEEPNVKVSPVFISVADPSYTLKAKFHNTGRAPSGNMVVEIQRQLPGQSFVTLRRDTVPATRAMDSLMVVIPIDPTQDKGMNQLRIIIDADNEIDEMHEDNNSVTRSIMIYEDEARPVYPYNFSIVNNQNFRLIASTANPFSISKTYRMEIDTTELFNSPLKNTGSVTTVGGLMEFVHGMNFSDSTVYYWRVSPDAGNGVFTWNTASFIYLPASDEGFNQSDLYQHLKSDLDQIHIDSFSRIWDFNQRINNIFIKNGVYPTTSNQGGFFTGTINDEHGFIGPGCNYDELIFNVIDPVSFKAWKNDYTGTLGLFDSYLATCGNGRAYNFQYPLGTQIWRKRAMDFIDSIPQGSYVAVRSNSSPDFSGNTYSNVWKSDENTFGAGNSLYHKLLEQGFTQIDSFNRERSWIFVFRKNSQSQFTPLQVFSDGIYDAITADADCLSTDTLGMITSPVFGPAKEWKSLVWRGSSMEQNSDDLVSVDLIGIGAGGGETVLQSGLTVLDQNVDITGINTSAYPYLRLKLSTQDMTDLTPYQLRYWRLTSSPAPEGAIAPNVFLQMKDTVDVAEPIHFSIAFTNITGISFDSLRVKAVVTDRNNIQHVLQVPRHRPLPGNDSLHISFTIDTRKLAGNNTLYVEVNPDHDQPEQYHFNNFIFYNFHVRPDTLNPLLDITFDNVHILNNDIVSAKPDIMIRLKDESKWFMLTDTAGLDITVIYPDGHARRFNFDNDTMQFIPAQAPPSNNNTATVNLRPYFMEDGDYELIVSARDMSQNKAGAIDYRVAFRVFNKPMISNMLNYPNPFTTSTAFVFTITGSEVPQNIRIQILTVTGKVVREITRDELGPLHIGRNITEFRWDGTDQYGQKLGNGVYLYRVITNHHGSSLEKFRDRNDDTDKYFNKGYGKMYLMR